MKEAIKLAYEAHYELCPHMKEILDDLLNKLSANLNLTHEQKIEVIPLFNDAETEIRKHTSSMRDAMIEMAAGHLSEIETLTELHNDNIAELKDEIDTLECTVYDLQQQLSDY